MEFPLETLSADDGCYQKSFSMFLERSSEHQCMLDFIHNTLPDILDSIGKDKDHLNVIGVGCGAGGIDLEMLSQLRKKHPGVTVDNQVVEPSDQQLQKYKDSVSKDPDLDHIKFTWNKMTANEFEKHWKSTETTKRADFIHMIQMLYYVKDPGATISFFHSLLNKNGKLLIILESDESSWTKLWVTYGSQLSIQEKSLIINSEDVKRLLEAKGMRYQSHVLPSQLDITECFTEGDENGELLLDLLTEVKHFSKTASPELRAGVLDRLRHPDCSVETNGRVMFNDRLDVFVIDP